VAGSEQRGVGMRSVLSDFRAGWSTRHEEKFSRFWDSASNIDRALVEWRRCNVAVARKYVRPQAFSRWELFKSLIQERPIVVSDLSIPIEGSEPNRERILLEGIKNKIPRAERIKVRAGQAGTRVHLSSHDLVARWQRGRAQISVTDFHFRKTRLERAVDLRPLSNFNLLAHARRPIADQEMMTLVLSSQGAFTDSHSDDPDGSNHCVSGRKLWLVWDTWEGRKAGLEDVERDIVNGRAAFDLPTFCKLQSACWLTVGPDETLFLPGRFTHRVITLEKYLGFGSFFVSFPNLLQTLTRWTTLPPLWTSQKGNDYLVDAILELAIVRLEGLLSANYATKDDWGLQYLPAGVRRWLRMTSREDRCRLKAQPAIRELLGLARRISAQVQ
jgi:hypothetical protein